MFSLSVAPLYDAGSNGREVLMDGFEVGRAGLLRTSTILLPVTWSHVRGRKDNTILLTGAATGVKTSSQGQTSTSSGAPSHKLRELNVLLLGK